MSNAARQRLYRSNRDADPTRRAEYLMKKKEKYKADVKSKKRKTVADMTDRERRRERKEWRCRQSLCRRTKRLEQTTVVDESVKYNK
jgi:hypothetical protein